MAGCITVFLWAGDHEPWNRESASPCPVGLLFGIEEDVLAE